MTALLKPAPGAIGTFYHVQSAPATSWPISHNLGYRPSVTVLDTNGREVDVEVQHHSANSLTITFAAAVAGSAALS